jgi:uncharacterized membrane protein
MDPVWSNIDHAWIWFQGGAWFGVTIGNYFGWFLTNWVGYQAFALSLRRRRLPTVLVPTALYRLAVLMYSVTAAGNLFLAVPSAVPASVPSTITGAAGRHWPTSDAVHAGILVSLLVMTPFALLAWTRSDHPTQMGSPTPPPSAQLSNRVAV